MTTTPATVPNANTISRRYRALVRTATPAQWEEAAQWYPTVQDIANTVALEYGVSLEVAASVFSAFSPMKHYTRNLFLFTEYFAGNPTPSIGNDREVADRAMIHGFGAFGKDAKKTYNFARNIAGDHTAVTIDSHMIEAAGYPKEMRVSSNKRYGMFTRVVTKIAGDYGVSPATMQALIWIVERGAAW